MEMRKTYDLHAVRMVALLGVMALAESGCGPHVVGVAKSDALRAWEPQPLDPSARITAVTSAAGRIYVGFSNAEMYFRPSDAGASSWLPFFVRDQQGTCAEPMVRTAAVTAFAPALTGLQGAAPTLFAAMAGSPGSLEFWRSPLDQPCWSDNAVIVDFVGLSASPFSGLDLVAVGPSFVWASTQFGLGWGSDPLPINFSGTVQALSGGVSDGGATRAWLGDVVGNIYYSDDVDTATAPTSISWTRVPNPGFPARPVVAISTRPEHPQTVWVTFAGLHGDSLWMSADNGASWHNPRGGDLASVLEPDGTNDAVGDAQAPAVGSMGASFGVVSPVPGLDIAFVAAIPDSRGKLPLKAFWTQEGTDDWWLQ